MDFRLNEDQISLAKAASEFLSKECPIDVVKEAFDGPNGDAPELYKKMADLGWLGLAVPEEHGGIGLGLVDQAILMEQLGYWNAPGAFFSTAGIAIPLLLKLGATEHLPSLIDGSQKAAVVVDPDFVVDGQIADVFLVIEDNDVRLVGSGEAQVTPHDSIDGTRRTASVRIAKDSGTSLGAVDVGKVMDAASALLCAESTGGMQRMLEDTLTHVKERTQFGRPIGSFQAVKHRLADALIKTESARSASYYAAWANSSGSPDAAFAASTAKAYVAEAAMWVTGQGIQLHGGIGFTWEHHAHLYFKRATVNAVLLGDAAFHRERALTLTF